MKIVLADLPRKERGYNLTYPSLAMTYLIGYARNRLGAQGHEFHYVDGHRDLQGLCKVVEEIKPDLFGCTVSALTSNLAYSTITSVNNKFPGMPIICGGPHSTAAPEHVINNCPVDICVRGEGEVTFTELIEHFAGTGKSLEAIDGIVFRGTDGKLVRTPNRAFVRDIDSIPMPAWDKVADFNAYPGMHFSKSSPQSYVLCSRGCPFDCNFCSNPVWKENKPWVRMRSPEKIAEEVQWIYELGVREIYLGADELNVNVAWAEEVCDRIAALRHDDLYFHIDARADKLTPRLARKLAGINVWLAHLGVESGNQRTIDGIGKHINLEQVVDACRKFQDAGIKVFGFLMLFHAWENKHGKLCWESVDDVNNTISFAKKLLREGLLDYISWQVATPWPGSRLWNVADTYDLAVDPSTFHGIRTMAMRLPGISEQDVARAVRKGVLLKTRYAVKSGDINPREIWRRGSESMKNLMGVGTFGGTK
jgi:radical SAM superfamily enzyme YgiQ (UPF0313 family)